MITKIILEPVSFSFLPSLMLHIISLFTFAQFSLISFLFRLRFNLSSIFSFSILHSSSRNDSLSKITINHHHGLWENSIKVIIVNHQKIRIIINYGYLLLIIIMQRLEAMVWALDRINNSPNLLPQSFL